MAFADVSAAGSATRATSGATDSQGAASPPLWTTSMRSSTRLIKVCEGGSERGIGR